MASRGKDTLEAGSSVVNLTNVCGVCEAHIALTDRGGLADTVLVIGALNYGGLGRAGERKGSGSEQEEASLHGDY